jgi:hypothetical protein
VTCNESELLIFRRSLTYRHEINLGSGRTLWSTLTEREAATRDIAVYTLALARGRALVSLIRLGGVK